MPTRLPVLHKRVHKWVNKKKQQDKRKLCMTGPICTPYPGDVK